MNRPAREESPKEAGEPPAEGIRMPWGRLPLSRSFSLGDDLSVDAPAGVIRWIGGDRMATVLRTYRVVLEWDEDGQAWCVSVPALPGCFTYGKTEPEAMERAEEAIAGHLEALAQVGEPIPPSDAEGPAVTVAAPEPAPR